MLIGKVAVSSLLLVGVNTEWAQEYSGRYFTVVLLQEYILQSTDYDYSGRYEWQSSEEDVPVLQCL